MLTRMAEIIRVNPSATVGDIAKALGYSEEKSVYYWLQKGQFRGLKDFRRAVLTGRFPESRPATQERRGGYSRADIPLVSSFSPDGTPVMTGETVLGRVAAQGSMFAYQVSNSDYEPVLSKGDILLIDPVSTAGRGDLALLVLKGVPRVMRCYPLDSRLMMVHLVEPGSVVVGDKGSIKILGRVAGYLHLLAVDRPERS